VSNSKIKKLKKEWEKQQKLHANYLEWKKQEEDTNSWWLTTSDFYKGVLFPNKFNFRYIAKLLVKSFSTATFGCAYVVVMMTTV